MGRVKLDDLIGVTMQWLNYHGVNEVRSIKRRVLRMLKNYKRIHTDINVNFNVCRHCLMESVYLLVPEELKNPFKTTFIDVYTFNGVIY